MRRGRRWRRFVLSQLGNNIAKTSCLVGLILPDSAKRPFSLIEIFVNRCGWTAPLTGLGGYSEIQLSCLKPSQVRLMSRKLPAKLDERFGKSQPLRFVCAFRRLRFAEALVEVRSEEHTSELQSL